MNRLPKSANEFISMAREFAPRNQLLVRNLYTIEMEAEPPNDIGDVYHYTSLSTAEIILRNGTLRFTNIRNLNDSSEYAYGLSMVDKIIKESNFEPLLVDSFHKIKRKLANGSTFYVSCLSRSADILPMWNTYTHHGAAVALNFDGLYIDSSDRAEFIPIMSIVYDEAVQERILKKVINFLANDLEESLMSRDHQRQSKAEEIGANYIQSLLCRYKSKYFEYEQEVRLVIDTNRLSNHSRIGKYERTFIDWTFENNGKFPIKGAMLGPQSDTPENRAWLQRILIQRPTLGKQIGVSEIPFVRR